MREIYNLVKDHFQENFSKKNWINEDFFNNEETGFEYFKEQITKDKDYINTDFNNLDENDIQEIANEIIDKLDDGNFYSMVIQHQVDSITDKFIGDESL